jgi:hypothetical protein
MSLKHIRVNSEIHSVFALDDKIGFGVFVIGVECFGSSHVDEMTRRLRKVQDETGIRVVYIPAYHGHGRLLPSDE